MMRTIKTYFKGAPFYNALIGSLGLVGMRDLIMTGLRIPPDKARKAGWVLADTSAILPGQEDPLYHRHGFDVVQEVDLPGGGSHFWTMRRPPQG